MFDHPTRYERKLLTLAQNQGLTINMYTIHARSRCQQRSIPLRIVELIIEYGEMGYNKGAAIYRMTKKARNRLRWEMGQEFYRAVEKKLNCYVVVAEDGSVITAGRRITKMKFGKTLRRR